ncbi:MAG: hypothetical protein V1726_02045 [Methanobacteriota archaeon]
MKEHWKTLLQAMILPGLYVIIFLALFALPIIQSIENIHEEMMTGEHIGGLRSYGFWDNPAFFPLAIFFIVHPITIFILGTLILYLVISYLKKRRKK